MRLRPIDVSLVAMCAALYAALGYLSYLGIFAPVLGVVRFWPCVFVPAVFSVAFGPWIGGLGAAIGIFISDMLIHGNALLSLIAGVPANFLCFYAIGCLSRQRCDTRLCIVLPNAIILLLCAVAWHAGERAVAEAYAVIALVSLLIALALTRHREWSGFAGAASLGLLIGSLWIGVTVWLCSYLFVLPGGATRLAPLAIVLWCLWVYCSEIPFLLALTPPLVKALRAAGLAR